MATETIIGFDSAWTDRAPGAICTITRHQGEVFDFEFPRLVRFEEAAAVIEEAASVADLTLVALDQPTLVPNLDSIRPAERVAGSIVNAIGGGVQPANRSRTDMFGDEAPIWQFLDRVGARENPSAAREAASGLFLIEVFPALALPSIIPTIWSRKRAAKYNPGGRGFSVYEWQLVAKGLAHFAAQLEVPPIAAAAEDLARLERPTKADQDKLDALICLTIGWTWRHNPRRESMVIGDNTSGYIVTPVSPNTRPILEGAASRIQVPVDGFWGTDASRTIDQSGLSARIPREGEPAKKQFDHETRSNAKQASICKTCPECGHQFRGSGWGGIDAHWRAYHEDIMPYHEAWPVIRNGGRPSDHPSLSEPKLTDKLIEGARSKWCVRRRCTTCGCPEMRALLGEQMYPKRRGPDFSQAQELIGELSKVDRDFLAVELSFDEILWTQQAIMWLIFGIWRHFGDTAHSSLFPELEGSWAGQIYESMKAHYGRLHSNSQTKSGWATD